MGTGKFLLLRRRTACPEDAEKLPHRGSWQSRQALAERVLSVRRVFQMAKLYFRYGAMNSGKSTALMQVAHNYEEQGMRVLILKPQVDTKGGGELVSRLGVRRKADLLIPPETDVFEAVRTANADGAPLACAA